MKRFLFLLLIGGSCYGQTTYYIRADSTRLQKVGANNELILENGTRAVKGLLTNYGNGRTRFIGSRISGDTLFVGMDTLIIPGGSTPTWQQTLTAGSTLTGNNTIAGGNHNFDWQNISYFNVGDASLGEKFGFGAAETYLYGPTTGAATGSINLLRDTIFIKPPLSRLVIDSLPNLSTQDELLGRKNSSGQVGYLTTGSGLSLSSGVLDAVVTPSSTNTLTNKRWVARVGSTTSSATPTINTDNVDAYELTAQAADISSMTTNLSGTPNNKDILEIVITGTGAHTLAWGASFVSSTVTLPTSFTTTTLTVILQYYTTSSYGNNKWVCVNYY